MASARERRISVVVTLVTSGLPLRSKISPRVAGIVVLLIEFNCTAATEDLVVDDLKEEEPHDERHEQDEEEPTDHHPATFGSRVTSSGEAMRSRMPTGLGSLIVRPARERGAATPTGATGARTTNRWAVRATSPSPSRAS
jgi:hypothetical protein